MAYLAVIIFFLFFTLLPEYLGNYHREKEIIKISKERKISQTDAMETYELLGGFIKVLNKIRETTDFYRRWMNFFIALTILCVGLIAAISLSKLYHEVEFRDNNGEFKEAWQILAEGFFGNLRFFIFESLLIALIRFFLRKISGYIALIELYKEWEMLLLMDVQRQGKTAKDVEKDIVSKDFQNKFANMLEKHSEMYLSQKTGLKLKPTIDSIETLLDLNKKKKSE